MRPNEMKYIQRSLSPHTRMPLGQHNPLQALGFLLDTRDLIHHRVEHLEDFKLHLVHGGTLGVAPQTSRILGSTLQLNLNQVSLLALAHRLEGLEVHLGDHCVSNGAFLS